MQNCRDLPLSFFTIFFQSAGIASIMRIQLKCLASGKSFLKASQGITLPLTSKRSARKCCDLQIKKRAE